MTWRGRIRPIGVAVAVFLAAAALCGPWGNYPLNDDWLYARTAGRFAATGALVVDEYAAAPGIVQALLAAPFITVFGFSHILLRLLTLGVACLGLWCVDRLLRHAGCPDGVRLFPLLVLALNPFWFYLSATFMTDIHALAMALVAAVLWFRARSRSDPAGPVVGFKAAVLVGVLMGCGFWNRQNTIVWLGALVFASVATLALDRGWTRLRRSAPALTASVAACALVVVLYVWWGRSTGNITPQFSVRLRQLLTFEPQAWLIQSLVGFAYMSVFLSPLLLLARPRGRWVRVAGCAAVLLLVSFGGAAYIAAQGGPEQGLNVGLRRFFPYLPNVLFNAGLGPVTFPEVDEQEFLAWPHWPKAAFRVVHAASILAGGLWALLLPHLGAFVRRDRRAAEMFLFGAAGAALSFALTMQGTGKWVLFFDRYHLPGMLGGVLALGAFLGSDAASGATFRPAASWSRFALPWLLLSCFAVAGLHDHFRWNDARWALVRGYLEAGGSPLRLQAGYEVNAWHNYDASRRGERPYEPGCCRCDPRILYCVDDTFWVGMASPLLREYRRLRAIQPPYWLTPRRRPVALYQR